MPATVPENRHRSHQLTRYEQSCDDADDASQASVSLRHRAAVGCAEEQAKPDGDRRQHPGRQRPVDQEQRAQQQPVRHRGRRPGQRPCQHASDQPGQWQHNDDPPRRISPLKPGQYRQSQHRQQVFRRQREVRDAVVDRSETGID